MVTRPAKEVPAQSSIAYAGNRYRVKHREHLLDSAYKRDVVTVVFHVTNMATGSDSILSVPADTQIRVMNPEP